MTLEKMGNVIMDRESKAYNLLVRCLNEFKLLGLEPTYINGIGDSEEIERLQDGDAVWSIGTINRHNGTQEDVTVRINVSEVLRNGTTYLRIKPIATIKVPKDASDKVIRNRVNKTIQYLNA